MLVTIVDFRKELENILFEDNSNTYDFELQRFSQDFIIQNVKDLPKLFRYSKADYWNIRNLELGQVVMSPIGRMNDIFEFLSFPTEIKNVSILSKIDEIAYSKSFSEDKESLLMWAHYADSFSGMCVEYSFDKLDSDNTILYHLYPIVYSEKRHGELDLKYIISDLYQTQYDIEEKNSPCDIDSLKDIKSAMLIKAKCWSYEKEWRIITTFLQLNESAEYVVEEKYLDMEKELYRIDSSKIKLPISAVYLGPRMPEAKKMHVREICERKSIKVFNMELNSERFQLDPVLISS